MMDHIVASKGTFIMSIMVVQVLPRGIILGADRNITETRSRSDSRSRAVSIRLLQRLSQLFPKLAL